MTRDLFGHASVQASYRRTREAPDVARAPAPDAWQRSSSPQTFLFGQGRSFTREELLRTSGFHEAAKAYPDHEILVVFDTTTSRPFTYLVQVPRNHPSRLDADGMPDPARQPFWRHGEIIHLQSGRAPP
ncbi:hypothetical protein [Achromobacter xylosoxidans]|uniref:Uncharacterized protein n=1 Tax=Alcaligenes xylosoxydans xylosoxydans TaxID=85698 RepID=A0A1R1JUF2_ALCXX|nr:hypothetical protein [Achromobacter xylosoxidans]OMG87992.1 hypothetical protein BIZ92_10365 [Achromobacter xylosoxidans]